MITHRYRVHGVGPFPIDMLRREQSYPADLGESHVIEESHKRGVHEAYDVILHRQGTSRTWAPQSPGWELQGWKVIPGTLAIV